MIKLNIKFFGILKDYFNDIQLDMPHNTNLSYVRHYIINNLLDTNTEHLKYTINKSIFSNNNEFLLDDYVLTNDCTVYLLPPFSGG